MTRDPASRNTTRHSASRNQDDVAKLLLTPVGDMSDQSLLKPFDATVVGAGPSGVAAARVLAQRGLSVALLDAGPLALITHARSSELRFVPGAVSTLQSALSYRPSSSDGGKFGALVSCVGGRGLFWNGAAPRSLSEDFTDWPIGLTDLADDYTWAEDDLFVSESLGETRLAKDLLERTHSAGIDTSPLPFAVDAHPSTNGWLSGSIGNPISSLLRSGMLTPADSNSRIRLASEVFVRRVDDLGGHAFLNAVIRDGTDGTDHPLHSRTVVLAAGGFESVRIAISSSLPDRSGSLGRNLYDHWFVRGYFPLPAETYDTVAPEAAAVFIRPKADQPFQIEIHAPGGRFFLGRGNDSWRPAPNADYAAMIRAFSPTRSSNESYLEVKGDNSPGSYVVHLPVTDKDQSLTRRMVQGIDRTRRALAAGSAETTVLPLGSSFHEAGGMRMGNDDRTGVLDPSGASWADPRLVAVDASAWPGIGCSNPHLTLVALAHRQANRLADRLLRGVEDAA